MIDWVTELFISYLFIYYVTEVVFMFACQSAAASAAHESRHNEPVYNEGRKEEGGEDEEEDYQSLSVRDIKQMFNKPDQKDVRGYC